MRRSKTLAAALLLCAAAALGQSPATGPAAPAGGPAGPATLPSLSAHDLELLHELETGDWHTRKSAEAELVDGDASDAPIIAAMIARASNPEARARLTDALTRINANKVTGASRITLHVKDAPADRVYAEMFRQAHAPLMPMSNDLFARPALPRVSLDADRQPFWTVMQQLYRQTGMMLVQVGPSNYRLARTDSVGPGPQIAYGPVLIVADQVQAAINQTIQPPPNPGNPAAMFRFRQPRIGFGLVMSVYIEPKMKVLKYTPAVLIDRAEDDNGNSLMPAGIGNYSNYQLAESGPGFPHLTARLKYPESKPGKRIAVLRGTATFDLLIETEHLEIPNLMTAEAREISINDKPIKFLSCKKVDNNYCVEFSSLPGKQDAWDTDVLEAQPNMRLLDADGHELAGEPNLGQVQNAVAGGQSPQDGGVIHELFFAPRTLPGGKQTGEPSKLLWNLPGKTEQLIVPIEFKDVDMNFQGQ